MIANRVPLVFGSDWPTSPMSPLTQINDAVFRESPFGLGNGPWHAENAVTFDQALFAYTQAGANMTPWAKEIGSITVGKWADFVDTRWHAACAPGPVGPSTARPVDLPGRQARVRKALRRR
jgi:predicted amidohydrolase YtcJ